MKNKKTRNWSKKQNRDFFKPPKGFNEMPPEEFDRAVAAWKRAVMYGSLQKKDGDKHLVIDKNDANETVIYGAPLSDSVFSNPYILHLEFR